MDSEEHLLISLVNIVGKSPSWCRIIVSGDTLTQRAANFPPKFRRKTPGQTDNILRLDGSVKSIRCLNKFTALLTPGNSYIEGTAAHDRHIIYARNKKYASLSGFRQMRANPSKRDEGQAGTTGTTQKKKKNWERNFAETSR